MTPISGITSQQPLALTPPDSSSVSQTEKSFSDYLGSILDQVNKAHTTGDTAIARLNTGEAKNMHEVMIAVEEADISMRMLVQMRNKALQAYDDIMRMQI
jgi:flagellar hook-basal body complex protein FliE